MSGAPSLIRQILDRVGIDDDRAGVGVEVAFPLDDGKAWATDAARFVRAHPDAIWRWLEVPANRVGRRAWWSLTITTEIDGVVVKLSGPGGWSTDEAHALHSNLVTAIDDAAEGEFSNLPPAMGLGSDGR